MRLEFIINKLISTFILLTCTSLVSAGEFKVITDDPNINLDGVDKRISIVIEKQEAIQEKLSASLSRKERFEIIDEMLKVEKKVPIDLDKELFYQDLLHYSDQKLKTKYSFLSELLIKRLKLALEIK